MKNSFLIFALLALVSCKNYYIPKDSFLKQFSGIDSSSLRNVSVQGPLGIISKYQANPIASIKCVDKKGVATELKNGPSIETRITIKAKKRVIFYFDRLVLQGSIIYGVQSRIAGLKTSVPIKDITKIEVQDGHKNYHYIRIN